MNTQGAPELKRLISELLARLEKEHGVPEWQPQEPVAVLVQTILSQNTSDVNSHRTFSSLRACFPGWEEMAEADIASIARCIDRGGLARIKAQRIKDTLGEIVRRRGRLDLGFLTGMGIEEGTAWLESLPGVGEKTSRCTLLFAFGIPALPVDTHIWRVSKRIGLLEPRASIKEAHRRLAEMVLAEEVFRFHMLLIAHGRKTCRARKPACPDCVVNDLCATYRENGSSRPGWHRA